MNRRAVLLGAAALIYLGAVMIGMADRGWPGLAAILALLLLYTVLLRPSAQWSGPGPEGALRLVLTVAVLAMLSGFLWLAGLGLALLAGVMPVWPGIALALVGITLARTVWSGEKQAQMDTLLDDALAQMQGFLATAGATGAPSPLAEDEEARWERLKAIIAQVDPALTLAQARHLAAALAPDLDREFYREAKIDLSDLGGTGALRLQLALMARREVMPWWDDAFAAVSLLQQALDTDAETAALACDVADCWLSELDADLNEATFLLLGMEKRLAALPADDPLRARLQAIAKPLRVAAATMDSRGESGAVAAGLAALEAGMEDTALLALLAELPLTEAMSGLLALAERAERAERAEQGDRLAARALVLNATRPEVARWLGGLFVPVMAFARIDGDAELNALFVERSRTLLAQMPGAAADMPDTDEMQARAARMGLSELAQLAAQIANMCNADQPQGQGHD